MRRKGLSLHRFGGVGGAAGRIPFAAGERRVLLPFSRRKKAVAAVTRVNGCSFCPRGQTTPQAKGWFVCRRIVSTLLPNTGQPRPFVSKQKDAKIAFPTRVLAANEIASDFHAAVRMNSKSPAGLGLSRPTALRYIWNILSGHYLVRIDRPRPEACARRSRQRKNHSPAPRPHEEKQISPQPVRRRRGRRKA